MKTLLKNISLDYGNEWTKINEKARLRKLNYFYPVLEFGNVCMHLHTENAISLIISTNYCSSNDLVQFLSASQLQKSVKKKYCWNLWLRTESNYATSQLHTHWTTLISTSMTMQLANSGILTVSVSFHSRHSLHCGTFVPCCIASPVIIFDNFSDKKIACDKLL